LEKAWDNWLFLLIKDGKDQIISLHDQLYTGPLQQFLRSDIEFIPHLSLGLFNAPEKDYDMKDPAAIPIDKKLYDTAFKEAKKLNFDYRLSVNKLFLVELDEEFSKLSDLEALNEQTS